MSESPTTHPQADWYPDPEDAGKQRYWDGSLWTDHRRPAVAATPQPPSAGAPVTPGAGYAQATAVNPGMIHSALLLVASFFLAGMTMGVGLIATIFAGLASWASYQSGQAINRGEIETATRGAEDAKRWRKITYIVLVGIAGLALVVSFLILVFGLMAYGY
jgi:hypothetical protein